MAEDIIVEDGYRITDEYVFFWSSFLSNWHKCEFRWEFDQNPIAYGTNTTQGLKNYDTAPKFFCTEQAFMYAKAMYFKDLEIANKILSVTDDPKLCKDLGREVRNYDDEMWSNVRFDIMVDVNCAKYRQNKDLLKKLVNVSSIGKRKFVEASPYDGIWGIKKHITDKGITDPKNWNGMNLLGKALDKVLYRVLWDGMVTVSELIDKLQQFNPNAHILAFEPNGLDGNIWQHVNNLDELIVTVAQNKERDNEQSGISASIRYDGLNDDDVIVRF